jgi:hypothetical protein
MQVMKLFAKKFCPPFQVQIFTVAHTYKKHHICIVPLVQKIWFYTHAKTKYKIAFSSILIL